MIVTVDPGKHYHGLAVFSHGELRVASLIPRKEIGVWVRANEWCVPEVLVVEQPHKQFRTVNYNILTALACAAGEVAGAFMGLQHTEHVQYIWPSTWKGQLDKPKSHKRIRVELSKAEFARIVMPSQVKTLGHNVMDAVGIGLWRVGRMRTGRGSR